MRISLSMLRRLSAGILVSIVVLLLFAAPAVAQDTGTYRINDYIVTLEPQEDGRVLMTYEQEWQVLSGGIPWITVGLPNRYFEIQDSGGDIADISDASGGGFYGVRLDLTKNFTAGETFDVRFTVLQSRILERLTDENLWRIAFTPGWYDRADIGHLQVNLISPVPYEAYVTAAPPPTVNGNTITWERNNINPGGRLDITLESTDGSFLTAAEPETSRGGLGTGFWVIVGIIVVVGLLIFWRVSQGKKEREAYIRSKATSIEEEIAKNPAKQKEIDEKFREYVKEKGLKPDAEGRFYDRSYGNYLTPVLFWAILSSQQNKNAAPPPGAGSSNSGCIHSCACVSCACACACACAGGGAAGCSRKTLHEFRNSQRRMRSGE